MPLRANCRQAVAPAATRRMIIDVVPGREHTCA
jgi:hypothetical protein